MCIIIHYVLWMLELAPSALNTSIFVNPKWFGGGGTYFIFQLLALKMLDDIVIISSNIILETVN